MESTKNRWFLNKWMRKSAWRWRSLQKSGFEWKKLNIKLSFIQDVLFKIVSVFEAIFLVFTICVFFLCCGCHF